MLPERRGLAALHNVLDALRREFVALQLFHCAPRAFHEGMRAACADPQVHARRRTQRKDAARVERVVCEGFGEGFGDYECAVAVRRHAI